LILILVVIKQRVAKEFVLVTKLQNLSLII